MFPPYAPPEGSTAFSGSQVRALNPKADPAMSNWKEKCWLAACASRRKRCSGSRVTQPPQAIAQAGLSLAAVAPEDRVPSLAGAAAPTAVESAFSLIDYTGMLMMSL